MIISTYIIVLLIGIVLLFCVLLIKGRAGLNNFILRKLSVAFIALALLSLLFFTFYNEYLLNREIDNLKRVNDSLTINNNTIDSLLTEVGGKDVLIDSLARKNSVIEKILSSIKSYQKISGTGKDRKIIEKAEVNLGHSEQEILKVESYNEIIKKSEVEGALSKGFVFSGETNYFIFFPPKETIGSYIDFSLKFLDDKVLSSIAIIYIEIVRVDDNGQYIQLFSSFYKPQTGLNNFKVNNYLKQKGTRMMVGFFWKKEFGIKDSPRYEKKTYILTP